MTVADHADAYESVAEPERLRIAEARGYDMDKFGSLTLTEQAEILASGDLTLSSGWIPTS